MACRGVHFALTQEQASRFLEIPDGDGESLMAFIEELEEGSDGEGWDADWVQETDKTWDAIHRCLTDGRLEYGATTYHKCILGPVNLHADDDYIVNFLDGQEVKEVASALKDIDRKWLRRKYDAIDAESYQRKPSDRDFEYTWGWFQPLREFFQKAAAADRAILFTVDQ
jgi:hypothetical protein